MLTMRPRDALRSGRNACVTATTPIKFTSRTRRRSSSGNSSRGPAAGIPALFTSAMSGVVPRARSTSPRARMMLAVSVRSIRTGVTPSRASATSSSARRTVPNTRKPRPARCRAMAAPKPVEAPVTTTPPFTPGNLRTLLRNPVHGAVPGQHVQLTAVVLPEGQDASGVDVRAPKRPARHGPIRVPGAPQPALAIIREEVLARERRETSTAIHEPTDDGAAVRVGVLEHRQHEPGGAARVRVVAVRPLHDPPGVIQAALACRLHVHFFPGVLADIRDVEQAARGVEGEAPRIPQTHGPDLRSTAARCERIVRGNGIRIAVIHVDPQQLAEQRVGVLCTVLRIAARAAVAHADVEHPVQHEEEKPAVVVAVWLNDAENQLVGDGVRDVGIGARSRVTLDQGIERVTGNVCMRVVDVEVPVRRVAGVERDAQEPLLTPGRYAVADVQEGRREQLPVLHDADLPRLLDDEQACRVPRRRGEIHRTGEPARHDGNKPQAVARRWRRGRGSVTAPEQRHNSEGSGQRLVAGHLGPSNMGPLKLRAVIWAPLPAGPDHSPKLQGTHIAGTQVTSYQTLTGSFAVVALFGCSNAPATAPPPTSDSLRLVPIVTSGLSSPVYLTAPPGDTARLFVVEQAGQIRVVQHGQLLATPFLDISNRVASGAEEGLLSGAFQPS